MSLNEHSMTKKWKIIEKIIEIIQMIFGGLLIFLFFRNIINLMFTGGYSILRALELNLPRGHNGILLGTFFLISGILIILNKKTGWIGNIIAWLAFSIIMILFFASDLDYELIDLIYLSILILIIISFLFILMRKPFLKKYKPSWLSYIFILIITSIIIADRLVYLNYNYHL